jgi:hypothetical protein
VKDILSSINNKYVEHLTKDITKTHHAVELKNWLGSPYYQSSNEFAKECVEHCISVDHIWGRKIKDWTDNALKCYDNFLLKYVQIDKSNKIPKTGYGIKETDVYKWMISKGGAEQEIGQNFVNIYQLRSTFQHIQIETKNGVRVPRPISNSQCNKNRDLIINWLNCSLIELFKLIDKSNIK